MMMEPCSSVSDQLQAETNLDIILDMIILILVFVILIILDMIILILVFVILIILIVILS